MSKQFRAGILGAGFMGKTHGQRLVARTDVTVVAVCDAVAAAAGKLKEEIRATEAGVFSDFNRMLTDAKLDVLYVCLPPFAHHGQVEQAAAQGIHLFLEKPIALEVPAGAAMVAAIEKAGVVSQVGFHFRFRQGVAQLRRMIADGSAGHPTLFAGRFWCNMSGSAWWRDKNRSGGQIVEQLIHIYDLAWHLFGEPASVTGRLENLTHRQVSDYSIEDTSIGTISFQNGALATVTGSNCAVPMNFLGDWRVVCERALLDYRCTGQPWVAPDLSTLIRHDGEKENRNEFKEDADVYAAETNDFLTAIATNGRTRTPVHDGLKSLRVVRAVVESAARGGVPIKL